MKKLFSLLVLSGSMVFGATIDDIDKTDTALMAYFNFTNNNSLTTGTISGWSEKMTWNSEGYGTSGNSHCMYKSGISGLSASGFTISFDVNNITKNGHLFTLLSNGASNASANWRTTRIVANGNSIYAQFAGDANRITATLTEQWTTVTIVGTAEAASFTLHMYLNGENCGSFTVANASNYTSEGLTKLQYGYYGTAANSAAADFDNLLIYSRALSADEVKALVKTTVPEPAAATLSLLALVGLAARRRRR